MLYRPNSEGDRAHAGTGEQQHAERDGHQPGEDEHRARARGLPTLETGEDLGHAAGQRPRRYHDDQDERGRRGPYSGIAAGYGQLTKVIQILVA